MFLGINMRELLPTIVAVTGVLARMWVALWLATRAIRRMASRLEEEDREHF